MTDELVERRAPVQGFSAGIPWDMHLRAYDAYCKEYRQQPALIEGGCRGGFSVRELDLFIPGWRDELDERKRLQDRLASLEERERVLTALVRRASGHVNSKRWLDDARAALAHPQGEDK